MRIALLWQPKDPRRSAAGAAEISAALLRQFGGLFDPQPVVHHRTFGTARLAWLELPISGFRARLWEERGDEFALAVEYPLNARRLVRDHGGLPADGNVLLALARALERDRKGVLAEMIHREPWSPAARAAPCCTTTDSGRPSCSSTRTRTSTR